MSDNANDITIHGYDSERPARQTSMSTPVSAVAAPTATAQTPLRQKSANGEPKPTWDMLRACHVCGAAWYDLDCGGATERGIWSSLGGMRWFCSVECWERD